MHNYRYTQVLSTMEVPPRFELGVELLQSSALPLGYGAVLTGYAVVTEL